MLNKTVIDETIIAVIRCRMNVCVFSGNHFVNDFIEQDVRVCLNCRHSSIAGR